MDKRKVRIRKAPTQVRAEHGASLGLNDHFQSSTQKNGRRDLGESDFELRKTMGPTDGTPNIEAEKGEVIMSPGEGGIPDVQIIGGKPHSKGGTEITASQGAVIYSNTPAMRITDPDALEYFGMPANKKGYTPAEIAKKFNPTKEKEMLLGSDDLDEIKETGLKRAIKGKHTKLLDLAILQEQMKNKPIPEIAMERAKELGIDTGEEQQAPPQMAQYGTGVIGDPQQYSYKMGGFLRKAQGGESIMTYPEFYDNPPIQYVNLPHMGPDPYNPFEDSRIYPTLDTRRPLTGPIPQPFNRVDNQPEFDPNNVCVDCIQSNEDYMNQIIQTRDAIKRGEITDPFQIEVFNKIMNKPEMVPTRRYQPGERTFFDKVFRPNKPVKGKWVDSEYDYTVLDKVDPNQIELIKKLDKDREDWRLQNRAYGGPVKAQNGLIFGMTEEELAQLSDEEYDMLVDAYARAQRKGIDVNRSYVRDLLDQGDIENVTQPTQRQASSTFTPTQTFADFSRSRFRPQFFTQPQTTSFQPQTVYTRGTTTTGTGTEKTAKVSTRTTKKQNVPKDRIKKAGEVMQAGDYYMKDGKYYKVIEPGITLPEYKGTDMEKVFGKGETAKAFAQRYQYLEDAFQDEDIKKAFAEKTKAALKNELYYVRKDDAESKKGFMTEAEIDALSPDDIVKAHLNMQKRNYALGSQGIDPTHFHDSNGKVKDEFKNYYSKMGISSLDDFFNKIDMPVGTQGDEKNIGLQQATYFGYRDLITDEDLDPTVKDKLKYFTYPLRGATDESQAGGEGGQISPIDMWYTNTTAGQLDALDENAIQKEEEAPWEDVTEETTIEDRKKIPTTPPTPKPAYWWAEDIGNVANLWGQRMGIKKYLPMLNTVDFQTPDVLYYDPNQALFANQAATRQAYDFMAGTTPSGPMSTSRASDLTGQELERSAGIIGEYFNKNVPIGNEYFRAVADTKNKEALFNRGAFDELHRGWTIANQQYDNSKRAASRNLFEGWRQGVHNLRKAQVANTLYPQYFLNPAIPKQTLSFWEGRPLEDTGTTAGSSSYMDRLGALRSQYGDRFSDEDYRAAVASEMKQAGMSPMDLQRQQMMQMYSGVYNPYDLG